MVGCSRRHVNMPVSGKADATETDSVASDGVSSSDRQLRHMVRLFDLRLCTIYFSLSHTNTGHICDAFDIRKKQIWPAAFRQQ